MNYIQCAMYQGLTCAQAFARAVLKYVRAGLGYQVKHLRTADFHILTYVIE